MTIWISSDKLPENPTAEDYEKLNWVEAGEITKPMSNISVKTDKFFTHGDIGHISGRSPTIRRIGSFYWGIGKINKPKRSRFGKIIHFNK